MKKTRVLICDDEPLLRDLIASHLCMTGFSVTEAYDGAEAIKQLQEELPDAILLDVNMPGINGIEVLKRMAELKLKCPVILITASTDKSKIDEAHALGVDNILPKPFNLNSINFALEKCFGKNAGAN